MLMEITFRGHARSLLEDMERSAMTWVQDNSKEGGSRRGGEATIAEREAAAIAGEAIMIKS